MLGFPAAMLLTAGAALVARATGLLPADALTTAQHSAFVYEIGPWSLIVALLAGAVGMLAMTSTKSAALIGVFISVTTVPAAGYAALAAALGDWDRSLSSLTQLALNLLGITAADRIEQQAADAFTASLHGADEVARDQD